VAAILFYEYVADVAQRRGPHREQHVALLRDLHDRGECVLAGAFGDPITGAVLIFSSTEVAAGFVAVDPYIEAGLVTSRRIEPMAIAVPQQA
jgi:uncharacterized protein YciI